MVEKWISDIKELHRNQPPPTIQYSKPMPDIDQLMGHSCKIGNAPILDANNQYFIFPVLLWYFWYYFVLRYMKKQRGQLEKKISEHFKQNFRYLCPHVTWPILRLFSLSVPNSWLKNILWALSATIMGRYS